MMEASSCSGKVTLFRQDQQNGVTYRVPALLCIPPDTLLAFAEMRSSPRDEDAKYLVVRRGQKTGASVKWEPIEPLRSAGFPGYRTMNPCPVYESKSQTVFLFFICVRQHITEQWQILTGQNAAQLCYVCSRDAGHTWSSLTDLTEEVIGDDLEDWATFAVGPGHGVQLSSGRLLIPAYVYHITARCCSLPLPCFTQPRSLIFYSDDSGQHWHKGELLKGMQTLECEVAEVMCQACDPVLYCNARAPCRCRVVALSTDQGLTFKKPSPCKLLCEPPHGCQGSVVSFIPTPELLEANDVEEPNALVQKNSCLLNSRNALSAPHRSTVSWLLYSHPTGLRWHHPILTVLMRTGCGQSFKLSGPESSYLLHSVSPHATEQVRHALVSLQHTGCKPSKQKEGSCERAYVGGCRHDSVAMGLDSMPVRSSYMSCRGIDYVPLALDFPRCHSKDITGDTPEATQV